MTFCSQLSGLMRKNFNTMKRNLCHTILEVIFPIFLVAVMFGLRQAFKIKTYHFNSNEGTVDNYIQNKSVAIADMFCFIKSSL